MKPLKALSVRQPWAWAIFQGKDIENRNWATNYRGLVVIHAAKTFVRRDVDDAAVFCAQMGLSVPFREDLVWGAALGIVEIVDCQHSRERQGWGLPFQYHWKLSNPQLFINPIPMKGTLGLFDSGIDKAIAIELCKRSV